MKVFISVDMEGIAGIVDWEQCVAGGDDYGLGRDLVLGEVNAAIEGAVAAGATAICVNDSHSVMRNLPPAALAGRASYLSGRFKPRYRMQGLDGSYDAILFLGYHAAAGTPGILSHTYNPRAISAVRLGGEVAGEAGLNALVAAHYGVPVAVITGDELTATQAAPFCPGVTPVVVKTSLNRYAAENLHPEVARELVRDGVRTALSTVDELEPPAIGLPATLDIQLVSPDMAEQATWIRGVDRTGDLTVTVTGTQPLALFDTFMTLVYLTRSLVETR